MMKRFSVFFMAMIVIMVLTARVNAADVAVPHSFESGTPAKASEVNENFEALENAVNEKVDISGDTMTGNLTVPKVVYSTPRTHRVSISGDMFRPRVNTDEYSSGLGNGGARITTANSTGSLIAQANLPDGATITGITYYIYDNDSVNDLRIYTFLQNFSGAYSSLHATDSAVSTGSSTTVQVFSITTDTNNLVNNTSRAIVIFVNPNSANSSVWTANLLVRGVSITYTLPEAQ